jgi:dethiobiotin synthetase
VIAASVAGESEPPPGDAHGDRPSVIRAGVAEGSRQPPSGHARGERAGVLVITGTGTGVGKTVVTAAIAALHPGRVAVLKPAQTGVAVGEPGDLADVARLAAPATVAELARYPDPLAPATAARRAGRPALDPAAAARAATLLAADHDLVLVEGAGGLLVRFTDGGGTLADVAALLDAPVLVVAPAGLGTLNATALTVEALRSRALTCIGIVIGAWPAAPDLAAGENLHDLPAVTGVPLLGALPEQAGGLRADAFACVARHGLGPALRGRWQTPGP